MAASNLTPAQRIVIHEQNIADNIEQIKVNEDLIETQEQAYQDLLEEQVELDKKSPTFRQIITFDDSLALEKEAQKEAIERSLEQTTELKQDTLILKEDTHTEQENLKQAHIDEQALYQQDIDALEASKTRSENRLNRLESYQQQDPEKAEQQAENIERERAVLAKREAELAEAKQSSQQAKQAAQAREAKVADDIRETCPLKCQATQVAIKSNNANRAFQLATQSNQSAQVLQVVSLSQAAVNKNIIEPPVSVVSVAVTGHCEKGKSSTATASKDKKQLQRLMADQYCPVVKIDQGPIKVAMPGNASTPLNFQAFCPDPPDKHFNFAYLFKNMFLKSKREPAVYNIETEGCDGSYPLVTQVEAYPKIKAEVGISISYKPLKDITKLPGWEEDPKAVDKVADYNKGHRVVEYGNWAFALDFKGSVDHINLATQLEHINPDELLPKLRAALNLFIFIFDVIKICCGQKMGSNIFAPTFDETGIKEVEFKNPPKNTEGEIVNFDASGPTGGISINYPKLSLGLAYENCEAKGKATLGSATAIQLKLDPLIGVNAKVDILGALIQIGVNALIPGAAVAGKRFFEYIFPIIKGLLPEDSTVTKDNITDRKYYLEGGVALVMTTGANISAEGKWTHQNDAAHLKQNPAPIPTDPINNPIHGSFSKMVGASMEMYIEGKAYVKGKAWAVTFEAGFIVAVGGAKEIGAAKLEYKLNFTEQNDQPMVDGAFEWNGLAIITASYKSFGLESKDNGDENEELGGSMPGMSATTVEEMPSETKASFSQKDFDNQWVLIPPGKTPEDSKPVPLNDYFNS